MSNFSGTILISDKFEDKATVPPFKELIPILDKNLSHYCINHNLKIDNEKRTIIYKGTSVAYKLYFSSVARRYFLCFFPQNVWDYAKKKELETAFKYTSEFFNSLRDKISISGLVFNKLLSSNISTLQIGDWEFNLNNSINNYRLSEITVEKMSDYATHIYNNNLKKIDKKLLIIDGSNIIQKIINVNQLKKKVQGLFREEPEVIPLCSSVLEEISQRIDKDKLFVFFIGKQEDVTANHKNFKNFLIPHQIPSQFISINNIDGKIKFGLINFIFEVLKKASTDPIKLKIIPEIDVDGFLCLSDVSASQKSRYFGMSISFTGGEIPSEDYIEIYSDIHFMTKYENIEFNEGHISLLAEKISKLSSLKKKRIDLFLTKKWQKSDIAFFVRLLKQYEIEVRKCIFISQKSNRFIFDNFHDSVNRLTHPYFILDKKIASIQTNTELKLYGTMYPLYIELLNSWDYNLNEGDIKQIIWLVKKRIYRLKSFYSLKVPENISLFKEVQKLGIENITGTLKISINHLL